MKRLFLIVVAGSLCIAAPAGADEADRLASEAATLFTTIMAAEAPPHRCQFGTEWMNEPVPENVARKFLGLTLHADVTPPFQNTRFQDIIDPQKKQSAAFCDRDASAAFEKAQFEAFEKDRSAKHIVVEGTAFTFPVFDATYQKAIVIIQRSGIERDRLEMKLGPMKPGDVIRHPASGADLANVYSKSSDRWKLIASELIGQS